MWKLNSIINFVSRIKVTAALFCAVLFFQAAQAGAATIADYQFTGSSAASADPGTNWTTSAVTAGPNLAPLNIIATEGNLAPAIGNTYEELDADTSEVTLADSLAVGNYYSFTVTPDSFVSFDFTQLQFDYVSSGTAQATAHIFSSIDGFTAGDVIDTYTDTSGPGVGVLGPGLFEAVTVDLSAYSGITTATEFRIYITRPTVGNLDNTFRLDNILLSAAVTAPAPVPEPTTFILLQCGLFALMQYSRKRRNNRA